MFQVRELSIKLTGSDEARGPLLACQVCDSTIDGTCGPTGAVYAPANERGGLPLLREQLSHHLTQLN